MAGNNLSVLAKANHVGEANAHAQAAAVVGLTFAYSDSNVDIDYSNLAHADDGANLRASGLLEMTSETKSQGSTTSDANSSVVGGGDVNADHSAEDADPSNDQKIGGGRRGVRVGPNLVQTFTTVGKGAELQADNIALHAIVDGTDGHANSSAASNQAGGTINSLARVELSDTADVTLHDGAKVTAKHNVDLLANVAEVNTFAFAFSKGSGFAEPNAYALRDVATTSEISADKGALVTAHNLTAEALFGNFEDFQVASKDNNSLGGIHYAGDFHPQRIIAFDANVVLTSGEAVLVIGADGKVLQQENVTVTATPTSIVVDPIANNTPGKATFKTSTVTGAPKGQVESLGVVAAQFAGKPIVLGVGPLFTFNETFDRVHVENRSNKDLVVGAIGVVNYTTKPQVVIDSDSMQVPIGIGNQVKFVDAFGFDVAHTFAPTQVDVLQEAAAAKDLRLTGLIDNPIGTTVLDAKAGNLVSGAQAAVVRTNTLHATAQGNFGTAAARLRAELVRSTGAPTDLAVRAGGQAWLDLKGLLRDKTVPFFTVDASSIDAANVDVYLRAADKQVVLDPSLFYAVNVVEVFPKPNVTTKAINHFRPDVANVPLPALPLGIFGQGNTPINATYSFGLVKSSGNINLAGVQGGPKVNIEAGTIVPGAGRIDVLTGGDVNVTEKAGDLPVGLIVSTTGDVTLTAENGNIVDRDHTPKADVVGNSITLNALNGAVGSKASPLNIDSSFSATGVVTALANNDLFLTETEGDLNVGAVISFTGDVGLTTLRGSIVDVTDDGKVDVKGVNITLIAHNGNIGEVADPLEIYSGGANPGVVVLQADGPVINVIDFGKPQLQSAVSNGSLSFGAAGSSDLVMSANGLVFAKKKAKLFAGGNLIVPLGSTIVAGEGLTLAGNYLDGAPGAGAKILIGGTLLAPTIDVTGGNDGNEFAFDGALSGGSTHVKSGVLDNRLADILLGGDGFDWFWAFDQDTTDRRTNETLR